MTAANFVMMLAGAGLVLLGVLGGALADRIRGIRHHAARAARGATAREPRDVTMTPPPAEGRMASDVIATLVTAGFPRARAAEAVNACPATTRSTIESWTRAALKQCTPKEMQS